MKMKMIKQIIKKTTPALLALPLLLTACQSDPEVGSTLYPTPAENYDAKAYINTNTPKGNNFSLRVFQTPAGPIVPNDTAVFYVKLNKPVAQDVKVTVKEAPSAAVKKDGAVVMDAGSIHILNATVTIAKGEMRSAAPVKVVIKKGKSIDQLAAGGKNGVTAVMIESAEGASVGTNYNKVQINADVRSTNIVPNGKMDGLTEIPGSSFGLYDTYNRSLSQLVDGDMETYYSIYLRRNPKLIFTFGSGVSVAGITIYPTTYGSYSEYFLTQVRVETSKDWKTWTDQGTITLSGVDAPTPLHIRFYNPVTDPYIRVIPLKTYTGGYMAIGEVKVYR